jgi:acyl-CoA synthetase (AMP-forming)/AMP-acid ligase II
MSAATTLGELARSQGALLGDKILFEMGEETVTYAQLDQRAGRIAGQLAAAGIKPGDRVGYLGRNHPAYFEVLFGAARVGVVTVPINWRLADDEIAWIVADADVSLIVADDSLALRLRRLAGRGTTMPRIVSREEEYPAWRHSDSPAPRILPPVQPGDVAIQLYTSGTTGRPKGALLTHDNLLHYRTLPHEQQPMWNRFEPGDVGLLVMPTFHIGGTGFGIQTIAAGASALVASEFNADFIMDAIAAKGLSKLFLVPSSIRMLLDHPAASTADFGRIRTIIYGASAMPLDLLREAMDVFQCGFVQMYGMTETCGTICVLPPEDHDPAGNPRMLSVGRPLDGVSIAIRDAQGRDLPPGEIGEVCVRARSVMRGYWRRTGADQETMRPHGWLHTGDAGVLDEDGYLYIRDRVKDMIVSGGENIYPAEVERVLQAHPDVAQVVAIGVPSRLWGEEVKVLIVPARTDHAAAADIVAFARKSLAGYKLPKSVEFLQDLPRGPTGKILRRELRDRYRSAPLTSNPS